MYGRSLDFNCEIKMDVISRACDKKAKIIRLTFLYGNGKKANIIDPKN